MKNPLLEVELPPIGEPYPHEPTLLCDNDEILVKDVFISEGRRRASDSLFADFTALYTSEKSLPEYLLEQLGQMPELDDSLLKLCRYLVGWLNSAGYMDCPLQVLLMSRWSVSDFHCLQKTIWPGCAGFSTPTINRSQRRQTSSAVLIPSRHRVSEAEKD